MAGNDIDSFASSLAENIGYMPVIESIGKAGSGALDLLSSIWGGGKRPDIRMEYPAPPKPNVPSGYDPQTGTIWEAPHYDPNREVMQSGMPPFLLNLLMGNLLGTGLMDLFGGR